MGTSYGKFTGKLKLDSSWSKEAFMAEFRVAQTNALRDVKAYAQVLVKESLGTQYYSLSDLRQMGHPYSVVNAFPPMPPGVINLQSGNFYRSMRWIDGMGTDRVTVSFYSDDEEQSGWLVGGGGRMMARPYDVLLRARIYRSITRQLSESLRKYVKVTFVGA